MQIAIAQVVSQFTDVPVEDFAVGVDGCGAPIFGISMRAMALAYARLVSPPSSFDKPTRDACERIVRVMTAYPELIGGTSQRLDTEIMRAARGRVVSKSAPKACTPPAYFPANDGQRDLDSL